MKDPRLQKILTDRENLVRILDNLSEGIIAHDNERRILFFNRAAENTTGFEREEVLGRDCHEVFGGPFCGVKCSFCKSAPTHLGTLHYPLNILTRDGDPRRIEMTVTEIKDSLGNSFGVIASFNDITDLISLQIRSGELKSFCGIIGRHESMLQIYSQIRELAGSSFPVLITGETGTGKELVAYAIHSESRRSGGPFVPINCAALPETILESELFGHVKGAFTGAVRNKKGRFELAHGGTIFLDEVTDLPKLMQAKLLRVLQEGTFMRVGGEETCSVDVRLISATNRDIKHEIKNGNFRDDLYYRINSVPIHIPPLRKRKSDIPILAEHFLSMTSEEGQKTGGLSKEALDIMIEYLWPGNIRELQSAIRFSAVKSRGSLIQPDHLPVELKEWRGNSTSRSPYQKLDLESVRNAISQTGGNKTRAARLLGVGRATLYRFLADTPYVS